MQNQLINTLAVIVCLCQAPWLMGKPEKEKARLDLEAAQKQCEEGHLGVCMRLGDHYERLGDLDTAKKYLALACEGEDVPSCLKLAEFAEAKQDAKEAMRWLRRACRSKKGDGTGCYRIATYAEAMSSAKNAEVWLKKACAKGLKAACTKIAKKDSHESSKDSRPPQP